MRMMAELPTLQSLRKREKRVPFRPSDWGPGSGSRNGCQKCHLSPCALVKKAQTTPIAKIGCQTGHLAGKNARKVSRATPICNIGIAENAQNGPLARFVGPGPVVRGWPRAAQAATMGVVCAISPAESSRRYLVSSPPYGLWRMFEKLHDAARCAAMPEVLLCYKNCYARCAAMPEVLLY